MSSQATSRREFLASFLSPRRKGEKAPLAPAPASAEPAGGGARVAVVQGRFCLAYQHSFCSTCVERCPVPGAIVMERGLPRVNSDLCTGCGVCHDLCPAPRNAILLVAKRPALLHPAAATGEPVPVGVT